MITTVDRNGCVTLGVGACCQDKSESDIENECECERCGLCGKHVDVMAEERSARTRPEAGMGD